MAALLPVLAVAALPLWTAAAADKPAEPSGSRLGAAFAAADTDKDGTITRAEIAAQLRKRFAALDADHNGTLTPAEHAGKPPSGLDASGQAQWRQSRDYQFKQLDTDGDGAVSPAELGKAVEQGFARADRDGDGKVGQAEFDSGFERHAQAVGQLAHVRGWQRLDNNADDAVDLQEFRTTWRATFASLDRNGDGSLGSGETDDLPVLDRNKDGRVTIDEITAVADLAFAQLDSNHDQRLSRAEYDQQSAGQARPPAGGSAPTTGKQPAASPKTGTAAPKGAKAPAAAQPSASR